jgi:hypothetical protein
MSRLKTASDYTTINPDYANGKGYYTTHVDVSDLLQISPNSDLDGDGDKSYFTDDTTPSKAMVGKIIKRVEGNIDSSIKHSFRPEIVENEIHDFESGRYVIYPATHWKDYVGFVQLDYPKVRKIIKLEVYQGDKWKNLASSSVEYTPPSSATTSEYTLKLLVAGYTFKLTKGTNNGFYDVFGQQTTVSQICDAINEVFPHDTAQFTGETSPKTTTQMSGTTKNISDFFYASPSNNGKSVTISSLLPSDAGSICSLIETIDGTAITTSFSDNEDSGRNNDWWVIGRQGKIFFRKEWPFLKNNSVKVTYITGASRVPSGIHDAATKMVAAEILVHDDNSILITETGSNIDLKTKHDILKEEAKALIDGKKNLLHLID